MNKNPIFTHLLIGALSALFTIIAAADPAPLTGDEAIAHLKETGQYSSLSSAFLGAHYQVRKALDDPNKLHLQNAAHGLSASFDREGLRLTVRDADRLARTSHWRLASIGREETRQHTVPSGELRREGQRAEIVRSELGLTEWFVNSPSGLEHGFTLESRPKGSGELALAIAISGDLTAVPMTDGQRVELRNAAGKKVLDYDKLKVWDADGMELSARMESASEGLRFVVSDAEARYPLTIDPTFTQEAYLKASNAGVGDEFGRTVAISGDTLVVGALFEAGDASSTDFSSNDNATAAGAAYVFVRDSATGTWSQQAYLKASNAEAGDLFGKSVAISGDSLVVGALLEDGDSASTATIPNDNASKSGAAYVFVRDPATNTWTQQAYLKAMNAGVDDQFGVSVAIDGDSVVIGALDEAGDAASTAASPNDNASKAGAAYVFVRDPATSTWTQQAYLKATNAGVDDLFGRSVAISGDSVVVGARFEAGDAASTATSPNDNASRAGAAYVFVRDPATSTWTQQDYLKASNVGVNDQFGESVAISGDRVVVGASFESGDTASTAAIPNNNAIAAGAAYLFVRDPATSAWTQEAYLKASNAGVTDQFGKSVSISGDSVVVGAQWERGDSASTATNPNDNASKAGAAYVFVRDSATGAWSQQDYLKASNAGADDNFGESVAISGGSVVVGAWHESGDAASTVATPNDNASEAGAAYVFLQPPPIVTNANDSGPGSLRDAILSAPDGAEILFGPVFDGGPEDVIRLNSQLAVMGKTLTIIAINPSGVPIAGGVTIDGGGSSRVLYVDGASDVNIIGLNIINANSGGASGGGVLNDGIFVAGACTFTGCVSGGLGGAVANFGITARLVNSTFHGNTGNFGGAIFASGTTEIVHSTITGNTGGICCGGIVARDSTTLENSIVAENQSGNVPDINQETISLAVENCLVGSNQGCENAFPVGTPNAEGSFVGTTASPFDPRLSALAHNGNFGMTRLPCPDSAAIDSADASFSTAVDQLLRPRSQGSQPDIGSVEMDWGADLTTTDPGGLADVSTPGDKITALPEGSPASPPNEEVDKAIDDASATKYFSVTAENAGLTLTPVLGACKVQGLTLTSANDVPGRDPVLFLVLGSKFGANSGYEFIVAGEVPTFTSRDQKQTFFFKTLSESFDHFRVVFPKVSSPLGGSTQIAEVELLGQPTDSSLDVLEHTIGDASDPLRPHRRQFTLRTLPGASYAAEWSPDMTTWHRWWAGIASSGYVTKIDFDDDDVIRRFHRFVKE